MITACDLAHEELAVPNELHWSVPDPVRVSTEAAFDAVYDEIEGHVRALAPRILTPALNEGATMSTNPAFTLDDPAGQDVAAVRPIRDEVEQRVLSLLEGLGVPQSAHR